MRIVITGSSGFVGSHLTKKLRELGHELILLDIIGNIDITNWEQIKNIEKFDVLIHLAAKSFVPDSLKYPRDFYFSNLISTLNVLELCRFNKAKLIYVSSYVYGKPDYLPIDENHPINPTNTYAQSKVIGEKLCEGYHRDFNIPVIIFRPFNIYGPGQNTNFLIPLILNKLKIGKIELKNPKPKRDFIYIDDIIDAFVKAILYNKTTFEIFNIGFGRSYSVIEVVNLISKYYPGKLSVSFSKEQRKNEVLNTVANIDKAKNVLGWRPKIDFEKGIYCLVKYL